MEKTLYIKPDCIMLKITGQVVMQAGTHLDPNQDEQSVTPSDEEYDGEFGSKQSVWSSDDE